MCYFGFFYYKSAMNKDFRQIVEIFPLITRKAGSFLGFLHGKFWNSCLFSDQLS